jgi:hypothetical protein
MPNNYYNNMNMLTKSLTNEEKQETEVINFYRNSIKYALNNKFIEIEQYFELINNLN